MRRVLALVAVVAAGCGGADAEPPASSSGPFGYDRTRPLGFRDGGVVDRTGSVVVRDVSYASPRGGRVTAYLTAPRRGDGHPAVVMLPGAGGDRSQLLPEARRLAGRGIVAMTMDSVFTRALTRPPGGGLDRLRAETRLLRQEIVDLRRAIDVLDERRDVDGKRIGFLGWSAGARSGAILAGVEPRVRALVLVAGGARPVEDYVRLAPVALRPELRRLLTPVDPLRGIRRARPRTILVQAGRRDEVVPQEALRALVAAAPKPQEVRWYDAGHVPTMEMWSDAREWLATRLAQ